MAKILHSEAIHQIRQFHPQLNRIYGRGCNLLPFLAVLSGLYYSAFFMQFLLSLTDKSCACTGDFTRLYSFFPANVNWQTAVLYKMGNPGGCSSELEYLWGSKRCSVVAQIDICSCYSFWTLPSVSLSTYISILGQSDRLCFRMVALPTTLLFQWQLRH